MSALGRLSQISGQHASSGVARACRPDPPECPHQLGVRGVPQPGSPTCASFPNTGYRKCPLRGGSEGQLALEGAPSGRLLPGVPPWECWGRSFLGCSNIL